MVQINIEPDPPERALVIAAHPDDIEFVVAGTIAKWVKAGTEVRYVLATSGDAGTHQSGITRQELAAIQLIWHRDHIYDYDVSLVLNEAYQRDMGLDDIGDSVRSEKLLLKQVCSSHESDYDLLNNLLVAQKNRILLVNRRGVQRDIESILDEHLCQRFANAYRRDRD